MWKLMGLFLRKNLLRCWDCLSILKWIGVLTFSLLLKLPPKKLKNWLVLGSFFLLRLLFSPINLSHGNVWAGGSCCSSYILDKPQKRLCRTVGSPLASLESLGHCSQRKSYLKVLFWYSSSELAELVYLPHSCASSTRYINKLHDFSVAIPKSSKDVHLNSFFPRTARFSNSQHTKMISFELRSKWL